MLPASKLLTSSHMIGDESHAACDLHYFAATVIKQALHRLVGKQVRLDYFFAVGRFDMGVPDGFRINDKHGTVAALVEASCFVDANLLL